MTDGPPAFPFQGLAKQAVRICSVERVQSLSLILPAVMTVLYTSASSTVALSVQHKVLAIAYINTYFSIAMLAPPIP